MGTRGFVAEKYGDSWRGRYHHWDSYPSGLGKTLWNLYHGRFEKDIDQMVKVLVHDHPAGWSTINANWDLPVNAQATSGGVYENKGPSCYCHEPNNEKATPYITPSDDASMEWGYVIDPEKRTITVLKRYWANGKPYVGFGWTSAEKPVRWVAIEVIDLEGEEPDWKKMDDVGYTKMV